TAGAMVVARDESHGSVGDAGDPDVNVAAIGYARQMLGQDDCTGLVAIPGEGGPLFLFDPIRPTDFEVVIFGAGHVARALVPILATLPCRIHWIDERADEFPDPAPPGDLRIVVSDDPVAEVAAAPAGCCFLVMTHSHALDESLAHAILAR